MMANGRMTIEMALVFHKVFAFTRIPMNMLANGHKIKKVDMEYKHGIMDLNIKVNLQKVREMDGEYKLG